MRFHKIIICCALAAISAPAATVVAPTGTAGVEGSTNLPGVIYDLQQTTQILIPVSYLVGLSNGNQLTGLQFRLDSGETSGPATQYNYSNFDLTLSQPSATINMNFDTIFDDNIGADAVLVRSGAFTIAANSYPGGGSPNNFGPMIGFTTPYIYKGGDLLLTLRILSTDLLQTGLILDAEFVVLGAAWFGAPYNGTQSTGSSSYIPVMQFQVRSTVEVDPVATPEPSTFALVLLGAGLVALKRRK